MNKVHMTPKQLEFYEQAEVRSFQELSSHLNDLKASDDSAAKKSRRSVNLSLDDYKKHLSAKLFDMGLEEVPAQSRQRRSEDPGLMAAVREGFKRIFTAEVRVYIQFYFPVQIPF